MPLNHIFKRTSLLFLFFLIFAIFSIQGLEKETKNINGFFGVNGMDYFAERENPEIRQIIKRRTELCRELGIAQQRIRFHRDVIESEQGLFFWDFPDLVFKESERGKQKILPVVYGYSPLIDKESFSSEKFAGYYATYISRLIRRFQKDSIGWEVPYEPSFSSNPDLYIRYLKAAYAEARLAGLDSQVVASFPLQDLSFRESLYKRHPEDDCDITAFPYYPKVLDEEELRRLIIDIQYLKMRFSDREKKIWISEMGILPDRLISDTPRLSPDKLTEWMVKAHITALASGIVECVFWNPLVDEVSESEEPSSGSGLVFSDLSPKPAYFAYKTMTHLLKDHNYMGSLSIHPDVSAFLFQKGRKKVMICWAEKGEYPLTLSSAKSLTLVNLYGNEKQLDPVKGVIRVSLSGQPVYMTGMNDQVDIFSSLTCSPEVIYTYPGEKRELTVNLENLKYPDPLTGNMLVSAPYGVVLPENHCKIQGTDKTGFAKTFSIIISPDLKPGFYQLEIQANMDDPLLKSISRSATIRVLEPVRIKLKGTQEDLRFKIETRIENISLDPLKVSLTWNLKPRGRVQTLPQSFTLASNDVMTTQSSLIAGNKEARLIASVKLDNGYSKEEGIGLMSIPFRLAAPKVDGSLKEWVNVPELDLKDRSRTLDSSQNLNKSENETEGVFQFWVTENDLYVGVQVRDNTPLINPFPDDGINGGDGIEIFLGLGGPSESNVYGNRDFHIGLSPGHKGRLPRLWNWSLQAPITGGEVVTCKTQDGYLLEAKIPFASLGAWKPHRDLMIGFDVALNNLDNGKTDKPPHTLIWNGNYDNRQNPSKWGLAIIW